MTEAIDLRSVDREEYERIMSDLFESEEPAEMDCE
jgi:hypothetical protein